MKMEMEATDFVFCTCNNEIVEGNFFQKLQQQNFKKTFNSFSDWGLEINPKATETYGQVVKRDFAFIPLLSYEVPFSKAKEILGKEGSIEAFIEKVTSEKLDDLIITLIQEKDDKVFLLINKQQDPSELPPQSLLENVIKLFGDFFEAGYLRYFVNNCLITDQGEAFENDKNKEREVRANLYSFIRDHVVKLQPPLKEWEAYEESFPLRPFFGEGLLKLPKYEANNKKFNWDDLYINPGMSVNQEGDKNFEPQ